MSSPDDMVGASAVDSYAAVEAYETGKRFGRTDACFGDYQATRYGFDASSPFYDGYRDGWALINPREPSESVDSSTVADPRSKPRDPAHRPPS